MTLHTFFYPYFCCKNDSNFLFYVQYSKTSLAKPKLGFKNFRTKNKIPEIIL